MVKKNCRGRSLKKLLGGAGRGYALLIQSDGGFHRLSRPPALGQGKRTIREGRKIHDMLIYYSNREESLGSPVLISMMGWRDKGYKKKQVDNGKKVMGGSQQLRGRDGEDEEPASKISLGSLESMATRNYSSSLLGKGRK